MKCPSCNGEIDYGTRVCTICGSQAHSPGDEGMVTAPPDVRSESPVLPGGDLTGARFPSGNNVSELERVKGWNWGAFVFGWIWCLGNSLNKLAIFVLLLTIISRFMPITFCLDLLWYKLAIKVGPICLVNIYLGIKGNELAWKGRTFSSVDEFRDVQGKWSIAAIIMILILFGLMAVKITDYMSKN